jgi:hypothetical protein
MNVDGSGYEKIEIPDDKFLWIDKDILLYNVYNGLKLLLPANKYIIVSKDVRKFMPMISDSEKVVINIYADQNF